jgi:hypothetical protein
MLQNKNLQCADVNDNDQFRDSVEIKWTYTLTHILLNIQTEYWDISYINKLFTDVKHFVEKAQYFI